jgi:hypothetical protein
MATVSSGTSQCCDKVPGADQGELSWCTESGQHRHEVVDVHDVYDQGIVVRAPEALTAGQTVSLTMGQIERKAAVQTCEGREGAFLLFLRFVQHDNRREDRLATIGCGTLVCSDRRGRPVLRVQVTNTSKQGAQVEIDQPISIHQLVRLSGQTWECLGQVRYCQRRGTKFVAGIQFTQAPHPKSSMDFRE